MYSIFIVTNVQYVTHDLQRFYHYSNDFLIGSWYSFLHLPFSARLIPLSGYIIHVSKYRLKIPKIPKIHSGGIRWILYLRLSS